VTIATLLLLTGQGSAFATASLGCEVADKNVKLVAEGIVSRGMGEVFVSLNGEVEVLAKGAPSDLRKVQFTGQHLTQRWAYGKALKLRIYRDEPSGWLELVIEAQAGKDGLSHRGRYVLTVQEGQRAPMTLRGRISCSLG
jgi:hypothetical protein